MTARQRHHLRTLYVQRTRKHPRPCCVVNALVRAPRRRRSRWEQMWRAIPWGEAVIAGLWERLGEREEVSP